ncbi:bacteriocin maturation protein [Cohnella thermotolerans]|uniref:bacteriocin maturation protein n=1 Tax=Cohnella thermotolerans TaxID=329858 RepID=UPI0012EBEE32|nr:bacteriocin maturation protein [Cohnella thermotolerans]
MDNEVEMRLETNGERSRAKPSPERTSAGAWSDSAVLAIGSGPLLIALGESLLQAGFANCRLAIDGMEPTDRTRLGRLAQEARRMGFAFDWEDIRVRREDIERWRETVRPYEAIVYVSRSGDAEALRTLEAACRHENKTLLPAIVAGTAGLAGPLIEPGTEGGWESAWRQVHESALGSERLPHRLTVDEASLLANAIALELAKAIGGTEQPMLRHALFVLDLASCIGGIHPVRPHLPASGFPGIERIDPLQPMLEANPPALDPLRLLARFEELTSAVTGIFHIWEEGDLKQLPLALCRVQPVDPRSEGPARLLPDMVCPAFTHSEARRDAGLAGIEAYAARMSDRLAEWPPDAIVGIGAGETYVEAICRGLQKALNGELERKVAEGIPRPGQAPALPLLDLRSAYYWRALLAMRESATIATAEKELFGFPVAQVVCGGDRFVGTGLNATLAMRQALLRALLHGQLGANERTLGAPPIDFYELEEASLAELLGSAVSALECNRMRLGVFEWPLALWGDKRPIRVVVTMLQGVEEP